jgi:tetratricopeptide (TPR) repeat protein
MATAVAKSYDVVSLEDIEPGPEHDGRIPLNIRRHFDIRGFGVRANRSVGDGHVVGEHDEVGLGAGGQEELYLVLSGKATFNVDGEPIYATAGTMVFVRDPAAKRSAVAKEEGTTILAIGGIPGKPYELSVGEAMHDMWDPYRAGDYEAALEALQPVLEERPEALVLFNVACMEAQLGRADDAISHLERAIEDDERIKEHIRNDEDLDSIREDPRFEALTA